MLKVITFLVMQYSSDKLDDNFIIRYYILTNEW